MFEHNYLEQGFETTLLKAELCEDATAAFEQLCPHLNVMID